MESVLLDDPLNWNSEGEIQFLQVHFLLLWPDMGMYESPWTERKYVFFTEEAARRVLAQRKAKRGETSVKIEAEGTDGNLLPAG